MPQKLTKKQKTKICEDLIAIANDADQLNQRYNDIIGSRDCTNKNIVDITWIIAKKINEEGDERLSLDEQFRLPLMNYFYTL